MSVEDVALGYIDKLILDNLTALLTLCPRKSRATCVEALSAGDLAFLIDFCPFTCETNALDI